MWRYRWVLGITLAALAIRMLWVHGIHPPQEHIWSDMGGYVGRAERLVREPFGKFPDEAFYPLGTHYLLALPLAIFGAKQYVAAATWWGLLSTAIVPIAYFLGGRLHGGAGWSALEHGGAPPEEPDPDDEDAYAAYETHAMANAVARVGALFVAVYYPLLSYTGWFLSEVPAALFIAAAALGTLMLADHGRTRDAVWLGVVVTIGAAVRPQILLGYGMVLLFVLWRRRQFPALRWWKLSLTLVPVAFMIGFSLFHSHHHTGRATVLAQNGGLNRAFGRCHPIEIKARGAMFGPPSLGALHRNEQADPDTWLKLKPARGIRLTVRGRIWDEHLMNELADRCVEETGYARQAYYAMSHILLLWGWNVGWPDTGQKPWRYHMRGWTRANLVVFLPAALVAMALGLRRRWARHGLTGMWIWSLLLTVALVFGSPRLRTPYDAILIVLGLDMYGRFAGVIGAWWRSRRADATEHEDAADEDDAYDDDALDGEEVSSRPG